MFSFMPRGPRTGSVVSAIVALSAASAFAGEQPASIPDPVVKPASAFPTCTSYCAVINADGSIARAHANTTAANLGTGVYQVLFYNSVTSQKNITKCAFTASPGLSGFSGVQPAAFVTVVGRAGTSNGVFVATYDQTGAFANEPFHLLVSC